MKMQFKNLWIIDYKELARVYKALIVEFLEISYFNATKYIILLNTKKLHGMFWALLWFSMVSGAFVLVYRIHVQNQLNPITTTEVPEWIPISEIDFPSVTICPGNRVGRRELNDFANFIINSQSANELFDNDTASVANMLMELIRFYDLKLSSESFIKLDTLHTILVKVYGEPYPIVEILRKLVPDCTKIIRRCRVLGVIVNCTQIFQARSTMLGTCCFFNYGRPTNLSGLLKTGYTYVKPKLLRVQVPGRDYGLSLIINEDTDNYVTGLQSNLATKVFVHEPEEVPDWNTGAVTEKLLEPRAEYFITIHSVQFRSSSDIRLYSPRIRKCYFRNESKLHVPNFYSLAECILICRLEDIVKFCGCIPFPYPNMLNVPDCYIDDIPCLDRWREQWYNSDYLASNVDNLGASGHPQCPHCLARCNFVRYELQHSFGYFDPENIIHQTYSPNFIRDLNLSSSCIVHIFFGNDKIRAYEKSTVYTWFELVAIHGNIIAILCGGSIITIIELIYYALGKLGYALPWIRISDMRHKVNRNKHLFPIWRRKNMKTIEKHPISFANEIKNFDSTEMNGELNQNSSSEIGELIVIQQKTQI